MRKKILGLAVLAAAAAAGTLSGCEEQDPPRCLVSHSTNFALYDLKEGEDATKPCADLTTDVVHHSWYGDPENPEDSRVAMTVETVAADYLGDPRITNFENLSATGELSGPENGICTADTLTPMTINVPEGDPVPVDGGTEPGPPAANFEYRFSNLRIVSTAQVQGTQWTADLEYVENKGQPDECVARYDVVGISPPVTCHVEDGDGGISAAPENCTAADGGTLFSEFFHEASNRDFDLTCDQTVRDCSYLGGDLCMICRPASDIPAVTTD